MATVLEVMAKLSGNSSGMVGAFKQASAAAEAYKDRVQAATRGAVDDAGTQAKAMSAGKGAGSGFADGFKGAVAGLGVLAATVGLGAFVKEAAAASDATDKFKATMQFAGLNTGAIDAAGKAAKSFADQTVYDLPTIQNTIAQLASNGIKDYTGLTQAAGNLNAVAGGNAETFKSVAMMMTQTAGAGKLTTENWNQLSDAIPGAAGPLMRALEEAGAYTGNFREAMEKGQITSDEFNAALMKLGTDPVAVEAAKSTKTFEGAIGSLQATINSGLMGALNAIKPAVTGAINGLAGGLGAIFGAFGAIYELFKTGDFNGGIGKALGVEEDGKIVGVILTIRDAWGQLKAGLTLPSVDASKLGGDLQGIVKFGYEVKSGFQNVQGAVSVFFSGLTTGSSVAVGWMGKFSDAGAALHGVFDTLKGSAGKAFDQLGPALAALGPVFAQLGPTLLSILPSIMTLVSAFSPLSIAITALTPVIPVLAAVAGQLAVALAGALAGALQVIVPIIAGIVVGVSNAVTWFMSLQGSAEALAAGITVAVVGLTAYKAIVGTISAVTKAWAAVQLVLNAIMAVNPVTLIILGIAALIAAIVLLVMNWDNVVGFITQIWGGFINWITGVMDGFVGWLSGIWSAIVAGITSFVTGLFAPIVEGFTAAFAFIIGIFTQIGAFISGVWTWVFNLLTAIGAAFWAEHGAQLTAAWDFIVSIFTGILNFIVGIWQAVGNAISAAWNFIMGIITGVLGAIWGVITSVFSAVWGFISSIFNTVAGFISGVWNRIMAIISGVVSAIWGVISSGFNAVWGVVSSIFGAIAGFIGGVWNGIIDGARGIIGQVGSAFSGIWGAVTGALAGAGGWLVGAGRNIVEGLINGVQQLAGTIGNAFLSMVPGWIVGPFKAALGIASPSKLFKSFGRFIMQGLGIGVNDEQQTAVKAMDRAAAAVTAAGSGMTVAAPTIAVPKMPDIAANLALPELTQTIRLNFVGTSPLEAMAAMARDVASQGADGYLQGLDGGGYSPAAMGARAAATAQAPDVHVNVTATVTNPFTSEEVQAIVTDVAADVTSQTTRQTVRASKASRGVSVGGQ